MNSSSWIALLGLVVTIGLALLNLLGTSILAAATIGFTSRLRNQEHRLETLLARRDSHRSRAIARLNAALEDVHWHLDGLVSRQFAFGDPSRTRDSKLLGEALERLNRTLRRYAIFIEAELEAGIRSDSEAVHLIRDEIEAHLVQDPKDASWQGWKAVKEGATKAREAKESIKVRLRQALRQLPPDARGHTE